MSGRRRVAADVLLVGIVAVLGACSLVTSTIDTTRALQGDGFANVRVLPSGGNGGTVVRVTADPPPGAADPAQTAGRDVWEHFAFRFELLQVSLRGRPTASLTHDQLAAAFGPRPAGFDDRAIGTAVSRVAAVTVAVGSGVVLAVGVLVSVLVVHRRRRRATRGAAPGPAPAWMATWWQAGGGPPPGSTPPDRRPYPPPPTSPPGSAPCGYGYRDSPGPPPS